MVKRVTSLRGKGRTVTQVCVDSGCTSGSPFLEVWRLDPPKGPSWKTWQPVLRAGHPSECGAKSGSGPLREPHPLKGPRGRRGALCQALWKQQPSFMVPSAAAGWRAALRFLSSSSGATTGGFTGH